MSENDQLPPKAPVVAEAHQVDTYHVPKSFFTKGSGKAHLEDLDEYHSLYKESIQNPDKFWGKLARELLTFEQDFKTVRNGSLANGDVSWFLEGRLNASYNCVDRHAFKNPDKPAIIYEADEPGEGRTITYGELLREVCRTAYTLKQMGVKKGDTVAIYLPMIPEAIIAFFAIIRIGALHSVVFAGFSSGSLSDRVIDANSKVVITTDEGKRGGKLIGTKKIVDEALKRCPGVHSVLVYKRTGAEVPWTKGRDFWWHEEVEKYPNYIAPESMNSEDPLFLLYTSAPPESQRVSCTLRLGICLALPQPASMSLIYTRMISSSALVMWVGSLGTHMSFTLHSSWAALPSSSKERQPTRISLAIGMCARSTMCLNSTSHPPLCVS